MADTATSSDAQCVPVPVHDPAGGFTKQIKQKLDCPYSDCNRKTTTRRDLRRHLAAVHGHGHTWYACGFPSCFYRTKRPDHLKRHVKTRGHWPQDYADTKERAPRDAAQTYTFVVDSPYGSVLPSNSYTPIVPHAYPYGAQPPPPPLSSPTTPVVSFIEPAGVRVGGEKRDEKPNADMEPPRLACLAQFKDGIPRRGEDVGEAKPRSEENGDSSDGEDLWVCTHISCGFRCASEKELDEHLSEEHAKDEQWWACSEEGCTFHTKKRNTMMDHLITSHLNPN